MKQIPLLTLSAFALSHVSCSTFNQPLNASSDANPLDPPGATTTVALADPYGPTFTPGTFVQTVSPNTAFFSKFPKDSDQPNKTLADYTDVKVISTKGSYVKVEVVDTGDVGYVPAVMLGEKRSPNEVPVTLTENEPPVSNEIPVIPDSDLDANPELSPEPEPAIDVPAIAPEPEIPGIEPPQVIDPTKPAE